MILHIYSLVGCPYSMRSETLLKPYNHKIIKVQQSEKQKYKDMNQMPTFPQIFLVDDLNNRIKIGGLEDTVSLLDKIFKNKKIEYNNDDSLKLKNFFLNKK